MDRPISNRLLQLLNKNILALSFAGMFFFSAHSRADYLDLATDLFEKGEWALCKRECSRALHTETASIERFQLLRTMSAVRLKADPTQTADQFYEIIRDNRDVQVSAIAAYEAGRLDWLLGKPEQALESFSFAFQTTTNKALFLRSSCSAYLLLKDHSDLKNGREDLISQISTSRDQWYGALFKECAKPDPEKDLPKTPNWIIRFYRSQISPAIGNRCTLEPSCSEYFHQAHQHHGLKSFPMIADRFFREPEVSNQKKDPVITESGQIRYRDPIENHDFWMKKK